MLPRLFGSVKNIGRLKPDAMERRRNLLVPPPFRIQYFLGESKMSETKCSCGCGNAASGMRKYRISAGDEITLAEFPVGSSGKVVKIKPELRGRKKFADVGLVAGSELKVEAHAPFGGLMRVRVMESSMAFHSADAENIVMERSEEE